MAVKQRTNRQVVQQEKKVETQPVIPPKAPVDETAPRLDSLIGRVYLITQKGIEMLEGADAHADMQGIQEQGQGDERPYTFYEDGVPVYIAIKNGTYSPLAFPEPGDKIEDGHSGMTSMELYGLAVTLPSTVEKIIELETEPKPSLIDQARKIMTPTLVIVGCILVIFLLAVIMKG